MYMQNDFTIFTVFTESQLSLAVIKDLFEIRISTR